jgi:hypothetical protein
MTRTIADELAGVPQRADHDNDKTYCIKLMYSVSASQVSSNACRLKIGLDLLAAPERPEKRAGRVEWQAAKALKMDICPRQLGVMLAAAEGYAAMVKTDHGKAAAALVLDRPMKELRSAFLNIAAGRPADARPAKQAKRAMTVASIARRMGVVLAQLDLLPVEDQDDALDAIAEVLENALPGWGRAAQLASILAASTPDLGIEETKPRGGRLTPHLPDPVQEQAIGSAAVQTEILVAI